MEVTGRLARSIRATVDALGNPRDMLCDVYTFLLAFEARFAFVDGFSIAFLDAGVRSGKIASALLARGLRDGDYERLARRCQVAPFESPAQALGWLFVVDYLLERGNAQRWAELEPVLGRCLRSEAELAGAIAAAQDAVDCLERWLRADSIEVVVSQMKSA